MKNAYKIAGLGLILGTAVSLAAVPASARGPFGGGDGPFGAGPQGGLFVTTFAELDLNGDGQITEDDLAAGADARLAEVDTDGDGQLTVEELTTAITAQIEERAATFGAQMPRRFDPATMAPRMAAQMLDTRDANDDGVLTVEELAPRYGFGRIIDRFDTDDDNAISQAEYDTAKQDMQDRFANRDNRGGWGDRGKGGPGPRGGNPGGRW